jgi:hypothetical protein
MATDAVIQFKYSDDVHLTAIYKRYDSFPENIIQALKSYLKTTNNVQWDFMVAEIISRFVEDSDNRKGIKMLYRMPLKKDSSFIYLWEIYPKEDDYGNESIPFDKSICINIWQGNKKKLIYSGSISDFKNNG